MVEHVIAVRSKGMLIGCGGASNATSLSRRCLQETEHATMRELVTKRYVTIVQTAEYLVLEFLHVRLYSKPMLSILIWQRNELPCAHDLCDRLQAERATIGVSVTKRQQSLNSSLAQKISGT